MGNLRFDGGAFAEKSRAFVFAAESRLKGGTLSPDSAYTCFTTDWRSIMSKTPLFPARHSVLAASAAVAAVLAVLGGRAIALQDKYTVKVPGGLAFSEFRGYEDWAVVAISENGEKIAVILGNPVMIAALREGIPDNGKPFPDGAMMAKIHWIPKIQETYPGPPKVPGTQHDAGFMVKDSKRFADSEGWGWGEFQYDAASDTFRPSDANDSPPQANDAKCGLACHTIVKARDFVFTEYGKR
jgi:Cytochrome P460